MMINGAVEVITASIVAGLTQHAALHPLDTLKVRLQYSKGVPMSTSVRGALGDAIMCVLVGVTATWCSSACSSASRAVINLSKVSTDSASLPSLNDA